MHVVSRTSGGGVTSLSRGSQTLTPHDLNKKLSLEEHVSVAELDGKAFC